MFYKNQTYLDNYFSKIQQDIITQDEAKFIDQLKKFRSDLNKEMDNLAKSTGADSDLVKWKKMNWMLIFFLSLENI